MELLSACQAVDLRRSESKENLTLSEPLEKIYDIVRSEVMYVVSMVFVSHIVIQH